MNWGTFYDFVALYIAVTVRLLKGFHLQDIRAKTNCWLKTKWCSVRLDSSVTDNTSLLRCVIGSVVPDVSGEHSTGSP